MLSSVKEFLSAKLHMFFVTIVESIRAAVTWLLQLYPPVTKLIVTKLFASANIVINGNKSWDIKVNDERFYSLILTGFTVGFFEAYKNNYFEVEDLEQFFLKCSQSKLIKIGLFRHPYTFALELINKYFDVQTKENSWKDGGKQYDTGIDWFRIICDSSLQFSCANFDSRTIDQLEEAAYYSREIIAKKLKLEPKMKVLDIGCGFGALAKHLASKHNVSVTGVTVSSDMAQFSADTCKGLDVNILKRDYREIEGKFDRITCIEMIEHVGINHIRDFLEIVHKHLKDEGLFLLQVLTVNNEFGDFYDAEHEKFLGLRITFPNIATVIKKANGLFVVEHVHNIGYDYGLTWSAFLKNLRKNWPSVSHLYTAEQYRIWCLYLACGTSFQERLFHLHQIVFTKKGAKAVYRYE